MVYEAFDVVVVPFPFTDRESSKRRPALVLSNLAMFNQPSGHSVLAMITSRKNASWPLDTTIEYLPATGLTAASVVRMKMFTLDNRLIIKKIGSLATDDRNTFNKNVQQLFLSP